MAEHTLISRAVAAKMRRLRQERGWSVAQLSRELAANGYDIFRTTLSNLEAGTTKGVSIDLAVALAQTFGVTLDQLADTSCAQCGGVPPAGFSCNLCSRGGS